MHHIKSFINSLRTDSNSAVLDTVLEGAETIMEVTKFYQLDRHIDDPEIVHPGTDRWKRYNDYLKKLKDEGKEIWETKHKPSMVKAKSILDEINNSI